MNEFFWVWCGGGKVVSGDWVLLLICGNVGSRFWRCCYVDWDVWEFVYVVCLIGIIWGGCWGIWERWVVFGKLLFGSSGYIEVFWDGVCYVFDLSCWY